MIDDKTYRHTVCTPFYSTVFMKTLTKWLKGYSPTSVTITLGVMHCMSYLVTVAKEGDSLVLETGRKHISQ